MARRDADHYADHYAALDSPWLKARDDIGLPVRMIRGGHPAYNKNGLLMTVYEQSETDVYRVRFENGEFDVPGDWLSILLLALLLEKRLKKLNSDFDWDHAAAKKK